MAQNNITAVEFLLSKIIDTNASKNGDVLLKKLLLNSDIEQAKERESKQTNSFPNIENVNRVEVIDENGRSYVNWKPTNTIELQIQDGGRTLKVFVYQK